MNESGKTVFVSVVSLPSIEMSQHFNYTEEHNFWATFMQLDFASKLVKDFKKQILSYSPLRPGVFYVLQYLYGIPVWSAAPQTTLWGGPGTRIDPGRAVYRGTNH